MNTECQTCAAPTTTGYLCTHCIQDLRHQLAGLPTLIGYIQDESVGHTKRGGDTRKRTYTTNNHLNGDNQIPHNQPKLLEQYLRAAKINTEAAQLLDQIHDTLGQWARHIARTHKLVISPPVTWRRPIEEYVWYTSTDFTRFLAAHILKLAADQDIGDLPKELAGYIRRGEKLINPPIPPMFCGPCPTTIAEHSRCKDAKGQPTCNYRKHGCATRLIVKRGALEVTCPFCKTTHDIQKLINSLLPRADEYRCTIPEMYDVLQMLGERIPIRTLYTWAKNRALPIRGYMRLDGNIGLTKHSDDDKPVYRVAEARKLRAAPKLTSEQRANRARKAAAARWGKDTA